MEHPAPSEVLALAAAGAADPFARWPDGALHGMFSIKPAPVQWFAGPLLADRAHVLAGMGGTSKTRLLYHLGAGAVLGRLPWEWTVHRTGSCGLFLTEDTVHDVHRTVHALGQGLLEDDRKKLERFMRVYPLAGKSMRLLAMNGRSLIETDAYDWLMNRIALLPKPVAFIGLDPALGLTEGDELDQAHQRRIGELADHIALESGAAVVISAHASKGLQQADEIASHAARGGGALTDAVRGELVLRTMTADEAKRFSIDDRVERQRHVQLQLTKANHAAPEAFAPIWLKRGAGGLLSQVTLEQVERGSVGSREMRALELLRRTADQGDSTLKFWRGECVAAGVITAPSLGAQEKAMERIRDALLDAGLVTPGGFRGSWIPA